MVNLSNLYKFNLMFNGKILEDNNIIEQCGIINLSNITLITNSPQIEGGRVFNFVDLRKNNIEKVQFSEDAPSYRICDGGLNIAGKCTNRLCETKGEEVIVPIGYGEFDLENAIEEMEIKCPICSQVIKPKTCGFTNCSYNFIGSILDNRKEEPFKSETYEAPNDCFIYYKPSEKLGKWSELKIYSLPNKKVETSSKEMSKDLEYYIF